MHELYKANNKPYIILSSTNINLILLLCIKIKILFKNIKKKLLSNFDIRKLLTFFIKQANIKIYKKYFILISIYIFILNYY